MKDSKLKDKNVFFGIGEIEDSKKSIYVKTVVFIEDSTIIDLDFDYNCPPSFSPILSKICEKIKDFAQKLNLSDAVKISKRLIIKELIKELGRKKVEERSIINLPVEVFHRAVGNHISKDGIKNIFPKNNKKVLVAMSGGVDSSVTALLLSKQGYEVIGSTMRLWEFPLYENYLKSCCSIIGIWNARDICRKLNLAHFTLDLRNNFKQKVVDYFCNQYLLGKTPNPCIMCNKYIKFGALIRIAEKLG
ncbi:MAG: hypothetical protein KAV97_00795, partial [Actinomycetia bacterium]|nr:hypothetical protein [Actinomycetes bacterium]